MSLQKEIYEHYMSTKLSRSPPQDCSKTSQLVHSKHSCRQSTPSSNLSLMSAIWTLFLSFQSCYLFFKSSEYRVILFVTLLPQRVMVSAVKSSAQLNTKQLMELLFTSQAIGHCKTTPTLQHGFLVQVKAYSNLMVCVLLEFSCS